MVHNMKSIFGKFIRKKREKLRKADAIFSLRKVALRIGVEPSYLRQVAQRINVQPSYLSKVERGEQPPPSEEKIIALSRELNEDPDVLLALAGKVSSELQAVILKRPELFARLIRELKDMPDHSVLRLVREVRDGKW